MRVGVTLPQFREEADSAIETARRAEALGIDGVFVFDHLWPLGNPDRPALHSLSLLGALAVETGRVHLGTLVARVSLLPDAVLVHALQTLQRVVGERLIAGVGTGDRTNRPENEAYGVPFHDKATRLAQLADCCQQLRASGVRVWAGGLSPEVRRIAVEHADGWNAWSPDPGALPRWVDDVRELAGGRSVEVSWGGQVLLGADRDAAAAKLGRYGLRPGLVHGTADDLHSHLETLASLGIAWAVCSPLDAGDDPGALELVAEAARRV